MNILALTAASVALTLFVLLAVVKRIAYRWLRLLATLVGAVLAIALAANIPAWLGGDSSETTVQVVQYLLYLAIAVIVLRAIFSGKKR